MSILENDLLQAEERQAREEHAWPFMEKRRTLRVQTVPTGPSMTKTDMAQACDINVILANYKNTGTVAQRTNAQWGDFPDAMDFQAAQNLVIESREMFQSLPANIRDRFNNDPAALLRFVADPQNRREAEQLGIVNKPAAQDPSPAPPSPPPPPPKDPA